MPALPFIFSNESRWKWIRHLSFWIVWLLFQLFLYSFTPSPVLSQQNFWTRIYLTLPETVLYLVPQLFLAYSLMYGVITKLVIPGRYITAMFATIVLILATALLSALMSITVVDQVRFAMTRSISPVIAQHPTTPRSISIGVAMLAGLRGAVTIGGIAAAIKLMKCFYEKQQAALTLEKEKINAELQMLKAQLHPHFLFNTLNNIYSLTQDVSIKASGMIMRLSGMLRYMLYEGSKASVPLNKELQMINDYIQLEAIRYDKSLELSIAIPDNTNAAIAPLILLPFVENAFKHGASKMIEQPWISLTIEMNGNHLSMKLINGKDNNKPDTEPGIGIANARKRLGLLYPQKHNLQISEEEEMFFVHLKIELSDASLT
ncbi:histidine kinase [Terrimonas sp. NA20]|uniref:Histidine kinase n=1 Tax=Terrimonas ginsenosidimutans TaxID=2908004 RepID=A0ABS9KQK8_9BACT|nr:histidine kinase [Terrimonas ginsenosidimutans]MCG2614590.1 histidine kinase [Terrimonas ginsenosidimutans]